MPGLSQNQNPTVKTRKRRIAVNERNEEILKQLGEERLFISQGQIRIETGHEGFTHPDRPGVLWSSDAAIRNSLDRWRKEYKKPFSPSEIKYEDTRLTIEKVCKLIQKIETANYAAEHPDCEHLEYVQSGEWDEGLSTAGCVSNSGKMWPGDCWIAVYVVSGGSEGLWLHVDSMESDKPNQTLLLGKSLIEDWDACWASAARIAAALHA
jgi:hypothetical protein